jgi:PAS domain S-box-containing protein
MTDPQSNPHLQFLPKTGEMGELIRLHDWSKTSLGPIETWETSLRSTLGNLLHSGYPMFLFWGEDLLCFYNDAYRPTLGDNGKHPALGRKAKEVWFEIWDFIGPLIEEVMTTHRPISFRDKVVKFYRNGQNEDIYWNFCYSAAFADDGQVRGVLVTCTETTENVLTKRKLEESDRRLRAMIGQAPVSIGILRGKDYITEIANSKALEMWGRTAEEILDKPIMEAIAELKTQGVKESLDEVYATGQEYHMSELPVQILRDGKLEDIYVNFSYEPLYNSSGDVDGIMSVGVEVTAQVVARKRIEASERKFRLLADSMPQHVWIADPEGDTYYFNQSVYDYSGLTSEQMMHGGWLQMIHPDDRDNNLAAWTHSIATGSELLIEHRFRRHDGCYRWHASRARPQWDEDGKIQMWVGTSTDIEEQKNFTRELEQQVNERTAELIQLNESLKKSEERYHLMVEEVQDYAIIYLNREGIVENWNAGAEKIKGYKAHEIVGKSFSNFYTEQDRSKGLHLSFLNKALKGGKASQEGWRVKKDGSIFWASVVITAVHNDKREIIGFSKVTHDLTEKKQASDALNAKTIELEEKNSELQRMNKELQSFAYISSHDLQEPLRKIQTFASRIIEKEYANLSDKGRELFNRMQRSAEQMQALINDLLAYSRTNTAEHIYQKVDIAGVVEQIKQDLREELDEKHAEIVVHNTFEVDVIHFQFYQLFYNLISNSIKFSQHNRHLRIDIDIEKINGTEISNRQLLRNRDYWHISIRDNGIGFESEYNERIFELFQRLHGKSEYKGTGIGLSIVKKIAENHGGLITARGELGVGATFDIYLPVERERG